MRLIVEEIEGSIYIDIILKEEETHLLEQGALLENMALIKTRRYYAGVRVGEKWRYTDALPPGFVDDQQVE